MFPASTGGRFHLTFDGALPLIEKVDFGLIPKPTVSVRKSGWKKIRSVPLFDLFCPVLFIDEQSPAVYFLGKLSNKESFS